LAAASELALAAVSGVAYVALAQSWRAELDGFLENAAKTGREPAAQSAGC